MFLRLAKNLACVLLALLACAPARAASIEVAPVLVVLTPDHLGAVLTVTNRADAPTAIQLRAFRWTQTADDDALTPAGGDMVVSPPIFQLGAGEQQTVRILLRHAPAAGEATWRLLLDELPATAGEPGAVSFALRLSMPVFAAAPETAAPALTWRITGGPDGAELRVGNRGDRHERLGVITVTLPNGRQIRTGLPRNPYVLAGVERIVPLHAGALAGGSATIRTRDDAGPIVASAAIDGGG